MANIPDPSESDVALADLLLATAQGDRDAFRRLYDQTSPQLFGVVLRILKRQDPAMDVLQETYLRIWTHASTFRPEKGSAIAWIATIARNRALDRRRSDRPESALDTTPDLESLADSNPQPYEEIFAGFEGRDVKDCLDALPNDQRSCILMVYFEGYTHAELAQRLGRPVGTIKSWIRRGLFRLKACLER